MSPHLALGLKRSFLSQFHRAGGGGELLPLLCAWWYSEEYKQHLTCSLTMLFSLTLNITSNLWGQMCLKLSLTNRLLKRTLIANVLGGLFQYFMYKTHVFDKTMWACRAFVSSTHLRYQSQARETFGPFQIFMTCLQLVIASVPFPEVLPVQIHFSWCDEN